MVEEGKEEGVLVEGAAVASLGGRQAYKDGGRSRVRRRKKNESNGRECRRVLRKGGGRRGREYYGSAPEVNFLFNLAPLQTL